MRIDSKQRIAGHPSMALRQLLRRASGYDWGADLVEEVLTVDAERNGCETNPQING